MYRKLYSKIMSSTMILCMIVTLFIPSCNVKAADIAMEYTSYEVLQWILMELGISASLAPEKQQTIVLPDGQEITKPNLGAELIREVNDSIELWWNANQMDDVVDGYDGGLEQFKSDFAEMLEWGRDGVIEITENMWCVLSDWGKNLNEYLQTVEANYFYTSQGIVLESMPYTWSSAAGYGESVFLECSAPIFVAEFDFTDSSCPVWISSAPFKVVYKSGFYFDSVSFSVSSSVSISVSVSVSPSAGLSMGLSMGIGKVFPITSSQVSSPVPTPVIASSIGKSCGIVIVASPE